MHRTISIALALAVCVFHSSERLWANPQVPGPPQKQPVALTNATIHPVTGPVIEKGTLIFDGGKITALGASAAIPSGAETIDLAGKHVYPSLFEPNNDIGLIEINSIR